MNTAAMQLFLDRFRATLDASEHVAMVLDQAGWHGAKALAVPSSITPLPPPYSPELNPVARVWLRLEQRFLAHHPHADDEAILDAAPTAWNPLRADAGRGDRAVLVPLDFTGADLLPAVPNEWLVSVLAV